MQIDHGLGVDDVYEGQLLEHKDGHSSGPLTEAVEESDAVICMGKVATLLTILNARETNKYKIEIKRKQLVKRL